MIKYNYGWITAWSMFIIFCGIILGIHIADSVKERDCKSLKKFRIADNVYICNSEIKETK